MLIAALGRHCDALCGFLPRIKEALERLDDSRDLTLAQSLLLAAATLDLRPEVILDLGTGGGNSATTFALVGSAIGARVHTFDLNPSWDTDLKFRLGPIAEEVSPHVTAVVGDIAEQDFAPLLSSVQAALIFWDAHGYAIANKVLSRIMPIIADKRHAVICHDIADNWLGGQKSYGGKEFWTGVDGASGLDVAFTNIGWIMTRVEQVIPILDFCWRNDLRLHSLDEELHLQADTAIRDDILSRLGLPSNTALHMAYFSMNETDSRLFPGKGSAPQKGPPVARLRVNSFYPPLDEIFGSWQAHPGSSEPGVVVDWIGVRYRPHWGGIPQSASLPEVDEEHFEWMDILEAVERAGSTFVMFELGAGYGRWGLRGALAARQRGKGIKLVFAEAEPQHAAWLREALDLNAISSDEATVVECALSDQPGCVPFAVLDVIDNPADASAWYGQAIVERHDQAGADQSDPLPPSAVTYFGRQVYERYGHGTILVPTVTLPELLEGRGTVDLIDMDVQGAEGVAVPQGIAALNAQVRRVHIGTHSRQIEDTLRACFAANGWINIWDFGCSSSADTPLGRMAFEDGVQGWLNPRLGIPTEYRCVYCLSAGREVYGGTRSGEDPVTIITGAERWSYAFVVPFEAPPASRDYRFRIRLAVRVSEGEVGVGVMNKAETEFHASKWLPHGTASQSVELVTPPASDCGPLVVLNGSSSGRSVAEISIVEIAALDTD